MISFGTVTRHQFGKETCQKQLCADYHACERNVEIGTVGNKWRINIVIYKPHLLNAKPSRCEKAQHKHQRAQCAEKVHGAFAKFGYERNRHKVEKPFDGSLYAKF